MAAIQYNRHKTSFFSDTKIDDLSTKQDFEIDDIACCQTKLLAYELFRFCSENKGFPFNDPELMKRSENQNLNIYQMRPYNEMAIKIMRKFGRLER